MEYYTQIKGNERIITAKVEQDNADILLKILDKPLEFTWIDRFKKVKRQKVTVYAKKKPESHYYQIQFTLHKFVTDTEVIEVLIELIQEWIFEKATTNIKTEV